MDRRAFFGKASAVIAGVLATCGMLPELVHAKEPEADIMWSRGVEEDVRTVYFRPSGKLPPSGLIDLVDRDRLGAWVVSDVHVSNARLSDETVQRLFKAIEGDRRSWIPPQKWGGIAF